MGAPVFFIIVALRNPRAIRYTLQFETAEGEVVTNDDTRNVLAKGPFNSIDEALAALRLVFAYGIALNPHRAIRVTTTMGADGFPASTEEVICKQNAYKVV